MDFLLKHFLSALLRPGYHHLKLVIKANVHFLEIKKTHTTSHHPQGNGLVVSELDSKDVCEGVCCCMGYGFDGIS